MRTIQSRVKPLNGRSYGTNTRLISQEELLGILEQDATVLTKGVADAEHWAGSDGIL
jgi:hypothetical protein